MTATTVNTDDASSSATPTGAVVPADRHLRRGHAHRHPRPDRARWPRHHLHARPSRAAAPASRTSPATRSPPTSPGRSPPQAGLRLGLPVHASGPSTATRPPKAAETTDTRRSRSGVKFRLGRRRLHHRAPLLQGRDRTPAPTSGTCGRAPGPLLATATFTGETALRLAAGRPSRRPVAITAEHDLRRLVPLRRAATTRPTDQQFLAAGVDNARRCPRCADGDGRRQRRLPLRPERPFPNQHLPAGQLLGRRRLRARPPGPTPRRRPSPAAAAPRRHRRPGRRRTSPRGSARR